MHHMMMYDVVWQRMVLTVIHWGYRSHIVKQSWLQKIQFIFITLYNQYGCVHHCIHVSSPSSHASLIYNSTSLEECRCRINMMGSCRCPPRARWGAGGSGIATKNVTSSSRRGGGGGDASLTVSGSRGPGAVAGAGSTTGGAGMTRRRRWRRRANDEGAGVRGVGGCALGLAPAPVRASSPISRADTGCRAHTGVSTHAHRDTHRQASGCSP